MSHLYQSIADELIGQIRLGALRPGDRMPGVRALSQQRRVSVATAVAAYRHLERLGHLEARDRSGFYVCAPASANPTPSMSSPPARPLPVTGMDMVWQMSRASANPAMIQLGAAVPDTSFLPTRALEKALTECARQHRAESHAYQFPPGLPALRQQVARHLGSRGYPVSPDEVVITTGGQEALALSLRAVTQPGDVVVTESPTFYGLLQIIELLGLRALEVPTDPATGISPPALKLALESWPVKACVLIPTLNNPQGSTMPDAQRHDVLRLLNQHQVTLIEDDIYGDLYNGSAPPLPIKTMDRDGRHIYCGSLSKTLSPGLRIGWAVAGQHQPAVEKMKFISSVASSTLPQMAAARFLAQGLFQRHLRQMRQQNYLAVSRMQSAVSKYFPAQTRMTDPQGGFILWVELPEEIDTFALAQRALLEGISFAPGRLFSASGKYNNCLRLSGACRPDVPVDSVILRLAKLLP